MPSRPSPRSETDAVSDAELFALVALGSTDAARRSRAQAELYQRHVRYLFGVLAQQRDKLLRLAGVSAEDLVQETFHRAFERAHTYDAGGATEAEQASRRTRAWLGRIALNLMADHARRVREVSASPYLERVSFEGIDEPSRPAAELAMVTDALGELSEREQDVLRVTALYHRAGDHQRLPNAVSAELAERWGTTNENIRAIRSRAMKRLKELLAARGAKLPEGP